MALSKVPAAQVSDQVLYGNRNLIINGDMRINQRARSSYTTDSAYTLDRWKVGRYASEAVQISQQASGLGEFPYCVRIQNPNGTALTNEIWLNQALESLNSAWITNKNITLSYYCRKSPTATSNQVNATIYYGTGTDVYVDYNYFSSSSISNDYRVVTATNDWTKYTFTSTAPSNTNQIGIAFGKLNGSSTAGASDYIEITGVQLEVGDIVTPFEHRLFSTELSMCQRYYQKSYPYGDMPGTSYGGNCAKGIGVRWRGAIPGWTTAAIIHFPVQMRSAPSISMFGANTGASNKAGGSACADNTDALSLYGVNSHTNGMTIYADGGGFTAPTYDWVCHYTANAEI